MKLLVPYIGELQPVDLRLIRVAEFLGVDCETLALTRPASGWRELFGTTATERDWCFVVNPRVMQEWTAGADLPAELVSFLVARFPHLLLHSPRPDPFDNGVTAAFSRGDVQAILRIESPDSSYELSPDSSDVCEKFAGLSFGPVNLNNDRVFQLSGNPSCMRQLISIAGRPFMGSLRQDKCTVWFLASEDVADLDAEVGEVDLSEYFSRFLPHAMALRAIFGEESWRPSEQYASIIVDDPLLRSDYGFLNFESLLDLMRQYNFHTTIAFIPHNFRRSRPRITRLFRENVDRFALCFHGNDHTGAEFASGDTAQLNTMLETAEQRMKTHQQITGVGCDRVMVFPQGKFSVAAMTVLKARNFDAAVNTVPHPLNSGARLTLAEVAQPAVLRYGNFPLFLRKDCLHTQSADIAFNCFFGKPTLIVEHHDIFRKPEILAETAARINAVAPAIRWSNLTNAAGRSTLSRTTCDGIHHILAYSNTVQVFNDSAAVRRCLVEWKQAGEQGILDQRVLMDGALCTDCTTDASGTRVSADVAPHSSHTFSVTHRNPYSILGNIGIRQNARAFLRRRLSEVRDNYLSKNPPALAAKALQRCLPH